MTNMSQKCTFKFKTRRKLVCKCGAEITLGVNRSKQKPYLVFFLVTAQELSGKVSLCLHVKFFQVPYMLACRECDKEIPVAGYRILTFLNRP